jgi:hypothetical protein
VSELICGWPVDQGTLLNDTENSGSACRFVIRLRLESAANVRTSHFSAWKKASRYRSHQQRRFRCSRGTIDLPVSLRDYSRDGGSNQLHQEQQPVRNRATEAENAPLVSQKVADWVCPLQSSTSQSKFCCFPFEDLALFDITFCVM